MNWSFTDTGETYAVTLENAALTYTAGLQLPDGRRDNHIPPRDTRSDPDRRDDAGEGDRGGKYPDSR